MEIRWYQTYDEGGVKGKVTLQSRDNATTKWKDVETVRQGNPYTELKAHE
jgi:hypothetical protein